MNALKKASVLVIDNDFSVLLSFRELLTGQCKNFWLESNIEKGLQLAHKIAPDLVLLDVAARKMGGYEICEYLKQSEKTRHIPVVFFSSLRRTADKVKCFGVGGSGYISRHIDNKRATDNSGKNKEKRAIESMISQIETCLIPRPKDKPSIQNKSQRMEELLQQYHFTSREVEILRLYASGYRRNEIATQMYLFEETVNLCLKQIFQTLEIDSRTALMERLNKPTRKP